jgi:hypothetical protein
MAALGLKLRTVESNRLMHWCPACKMGHGVVVGGPEGWTFNGDIEKPTFHPSVRVISSRGVKNEDGSIKRDEKGHAVMEEYTLCHYFLRNGILEFCGDSPHALADQNVPLPDFP